MCEEVKDSGEYVSNDKDSLFYGCPRYVRVGSMRVEIKIMHPDVADSCGLLGRAFTDSGEIELAEVKNPHSLANTALHEVLHVINRNRGIYSGADEETITEQVATGFCDFRVFNPNFFKWWEGLLSA